MTFTDRVMDFFRERPNQWIRAVEFERVGGRQAWRSRIAEARLKFQAEGIGTIENRCRRVQWHGETIVLSEYRFVPQPTADAHGQLALI